MKEEEGGEEGEEEARGFWRHPPTHLSQIIGRKEEESRGRERRRGGEGGEENSGFLDMTKTPLGFLGRQKSVSKTP